MIYLDLIEKSSVKADLRSFGVPLIQVLGFDIQLFLKIIELSISMREHLQRVRVTIIRVIKNIN